MILSDERKFTWEQQRDAETIARARQIEADPVRMRAAQDVLKQSLAETRMAVGEEPIVPAPSRRNNPATIRRGFIPSPTQI